MYYIFSVVNIGYFDLLTFIYDWWLSFITSDMPSTKFGKWSTRFRSLHYIWCIGGESTPLKLTSRLEWPLGANVESSFWDHVNEKRLMIGKIYW